MVMKSESMRYVGHVCMAEMRSAYNILVRKLQEKRPLGRSRHMWKGNIKIFLVKIGCEGVEWNELAQDRLP